jgi:hypothetical protein
MKLDHIGAADDHHVLLSVWEASGLPFLPKAGYPYNFQLQNTQYVPRLLSSLTNRRIHKEKDYDRYE